ncbi:receptor-like serine/threonine-protein kinase SD1-7 [Zingiber officinale]|uniref:receptor-like serine/threonine-protein kinase SD1-7 n=1 Tax=Zingiber officinale TaxID=94328 RepID=UPI001C4B79DB|nr:receptor-like serine/threonine-protein kinase SD1-7 [Zingiber officinale]
MFPCGPNSYCSSNISPPCTCLRGFHPRNQHNWDMLVGEAGCMRTKPLDCLNNTDEFFRLSVTKLPDASRSTVLNANWNFEECRFFCLSNCACRAYAASIISGNGSGSGSGCLIWTEDLTDITVNGTSPSEARHANRNILMFVILPPVILFLACVAYSIWRRKKTSSHIDYEAEEKDMELPLFDLTTIKDATDDFSADNKLGQGGFGPVYKGKLGDDQEIAVKRLSKTSSQGVDEFKNEITLIAKLQHRNLVKLLGCCIQGGERLLIYEYMSNGSLDNFLFDEVQTVLLDWRARYNIILGVARGLLYLHHDSRLRIIHRDLKASNILLDKNMNPKISDFGMARIFGGDESVSITKRVVGT